MSVFRLDGPLTIATVDALRTQILERLWSGPRLELDCAADAEVDVSFVQLLVAARKSAESSGRSLALTADARAALHGTLVRGGFVTADGRAAPGLAWLAGEAT